MRFQREPESTGTIILTCIVVLAAGYAFLASDWPMVDQFLVTFWHGCKAGPD